jgi:nicotinate-nucleotide adenylyltransferase
MKATGNSDTGGTRIGLLGGTFNPIHNGHLKTAELVSRRLGLKRVLFIPSYIPPHKESFDVLPARHRMKMVRLALQDYPGFFPSTVEIDSPRTSYSIHTIPKIKNIHPCAELFFILGIDAFLEIETWREYRKVLDLCSFAVISRPGYSLDKAWSLLGAEYADRITTLPGEGGEPSASGRPLVYLLDMETPDISSTDIRNRIRAGHSIEGLVPDPVAVYIQSNGLYQELC